jgi:hypothetical protein
MMLLLEWLDGAERKCAVAMGNCEYVGYVLDELTATGHVVKVVGISEGSAQAGKDTEARQRGRAWVAKTL